MYTYVKTLVRARSRNSTWVEEDIRNFDVFKLWPNYSKILVILTHPVLEGEHTLNLKDVEDLLTKVMPGTTFQEWLVSLGDTSLPTTEGAPVLNPKFVQYRDGLQAGYNAQLVHRTLSFDSQIPNVEKQDLLLSKSGVDYEDFCKKCLVTINGFLHYADYSPSGIHVMDAATTMRVSNENHFGILGFGNLGEIEVVRITNEMISKPNVDSSLSQYAYIGVTGVDDIENKIAMISIGGYLHSLDGIFKYIGNNLFRIDFNNFPLVERYFEMSKNLDITSITNHLVEKNGNFDQIAIEDISSDSVIKALLTLSQSFLVFINNDDVYIDRLELEPTQTPGRYFTGVKPLYPVIVGLGRIYDYWTITEDDVYVVAGVNNFNTYYNFETTHWLDDNSIDPTRNTINPERYSRAHFLKIGSDL